MAKRKRLTPAQSGFLGAAPETKSAPAVAPLSPPIAQVAGEASATAALQELSDMVQDARAEGRLIRALSLDAVQVDYMLRDRLLAPEDEDMQALIDSLRTRGQQTPIDVVDLGNDRFGLVSGLRRLTAMRSLRRESAGLGFTQINARIISPQNGPDAYISMVEENEIRAGLSYYERARIVVKSVEAGIFPDTRDALLTLYGNAARAKRSKIKSFTVLVEALDTVLRFPTAIGERQGLELSKALGDDAGLVDRLRAQFDGFDAPDAEAEQNRLREVLSLSALPSAEAENTPEPAPIAPVLSNPPPNYGKIRPETDAKSVDQQTMQSNTLRKSKDYPESVNAPSGLSADKSITVQVLRDGRELLLSGPGVSDNLRAELEAWLAARAV